MRFKIEKIPPEVLLCHVLEPLSEEEAKQCLLGVEKLLKNGKNKIIFQFSPNALQGTYGQVFFEKALQSFKILAQKTGGNIHCLGPDQDLSLTLQAWSHVPAEWIQERERLVQKNQLLQEALELVIKGLFDPSYTPESFSQITTPLQKILQS